MTERDSIAGRLIRRKEQIISTWLKRVWDDIPSARDNSTPALRDAMPLFLDRLVDLLRARAPTAVVKPLSREHAEQRIQITDYTIDEFLFEYDLLRKVIFEVLEIEDPLPVWARDAILDAIGLGVCEAGAEFTRAWSTQEKSKREGLEVKINRMANERETRERFVSMLTHDLRSPLTAAKACAQLILGDLNDLKAHGACANRILESVNRTDRMIRDLLDVSRIRAGEEIPLEISEGNLHEIAQDAIRELTHTYGDRFVLSGRSDLRGFWSLEDVRRVIDNLAANAAKYGAPKTPIEIALRKKGAEIEISVHNFGNPIPVSQRDRLFQQFTRSSQDKEGWGLGLTLVKGVTEAHGGKVSVQSSPSEGTTFTVTFPIDCRTRAKKIA